MPNKNRHHFRSACCVPGRDCALCLGESTFSNLAKFSRGCCFLLPFLDEEVRPRESEGLTACPSGRWSAKPGPSPRVQPLISKRWGPPQARLLVAKLTAQWTCGSVRPGTQQDRVTQLRMGGWCSPRHPEKRLLRGPGGGGISQMQNFSDEAITFICKGTTHLEELHI